MVRVRVLTTRWHGHNDASDTSEKGDDLNPTFGLDETSSDELRTPVEYKNTRGKEHHLRNNINNPK